MSALVVASYNVHGAVDGSGRPFDAVSNCLKLEADVLVLQEVFEPAEGPSLVHELARHGDYQAVRAPAANARVYGSGAPRPTDGAWGPLLRRQPGVGLRIERSGHRLKGGRGVAGTIGAVVLTRLPIEEQRIVDLGQLRGDVRRSAVVVDVAAPGGSFTIVGVHMSHLEQGSPIQFRRLRASLPRRANTVVAGDMNMWGPPLAFLLPGWKRAVRGRTWPSWRPAFQLDHVLVPSGVSARGEVEKAMLGSDHLPVRVEIEVS